MLITFCSCLFILITIGLVFFVIRPAVSQLENEYRTTRSTGDRNAEALFSYVELGGKVGQNSGWPQKETINDPSDTIVLPDNNQDLSNHPDLQTISFQQSVVSDEVAHHLL